MDRVVWLSLSSGSSVARCLAGSLVAVLRVAMVLFALQFSGVIHDASDVAVAGVGGEADHERCPLDGPCDECPIGCPNCHCPAPVRPPPPPVQVVTTLGDRLALASLYETQAPDGPDLPSIFRPPRGPLSAS